MRTGVFLADIGGTHARFTLRFDDGTFSPAVDLPTERFEDLRAAAAESLSLLWKPLPFAVSVREAAVAVAGPVTGDRIELTNVAWSFSIEETQRALGLDRLLVINDVAALAWAIPVLEAGEERPSGDRSDEKPGKRREASMEGKDELPGEGREVLGERKARGAEIAGVSGRAGGGEVAAVVAVGTGLGVATWARAADGEAEVVLASEGGHRDLAATTEREWRVVERLRARFGAHVSVERAVSGQGLANLWLALAELDGGHAGGSVSPEEVTRRAAAGEGRAVEALRLFAGWLGAFAGDLALTVGARGGIWLGGGVLGAIEAAGAPLDRARIRERFLGKGRFEEWIGAVPMRAIDNPLAAFHGLSRALSANR